MPYPETTHSPHGRAAYDRSTLARWTDVDPLLVGSVTFITNVAPTGSGLVYSKTYESDTSPASKVITGCESDTDDVTVTVEVDGGPGDWQPTVTIVGGTEAVEVTNLTRQGSAGRVFEGSAAIEAAANTTISAIVDDGAVSVNRVAYVRAAAPPEILSASFGSYPGSQTQVKSTDAIHITGTVDTTATKIVVKDAGASSSEQEFPGDYSGGTFDVTITVGSRSSATQTCTLFAENTNGTPGGDYVTDNTVDQNQTYPTIPSAATIEASRTYNGGSGQEALKGVESCTVDATITDVGGSPTYSYTCLQGPNELTVASPTVYAVTKTWTRAAGVTGYRDDDDADNCRISATRTENDATSTRDFTIEIADDTPVITIEGATSRLRTDDGTNGYKDHWITVRLDHKVHSSENSSVTAPKGTFQGSWAQNGDYRWRRQLRVLDADILQGGTGANNYSWTGPVGKNRALQEANSVTTNPDYDIGGFEARTLTIPAWPNREADMSVYAVDTSKLTCENLSKGGEGPNGGTIFTFDNSPGSGTPDDEVDKFCITNGSDVVDDDGQFWYNKDVANAQSNLTGTAQTIVEETA